MDSWTIHNRWIDWLLSLKSRLQWALFRFPSLLDGLYTHCTKFRFIFNNISKSLFSIKYDFILHQPNFLSIRTHQEILIPYRNSIEKSRRTKMKEMAKKKPESLANMTSGYYYNNQLFHIYSGGNWMLYYRLMGVNKTIHQSVKTSKFDCIDVQYNSINSYTSSFGGMICGSTDSHMFIITIHQLTCVFIIYKRANKRLVFCRSLNSLLRDWIL